MRGWYLKAGFNLAFGLFVWVILSTLLFFITFGIWFDDVRINSIAWNLGLLGPLIMAGLAHCIYPERVKLKSSLLVFGVLVFPIAMLSLFFSESNIRTGVDPGYKQINLSITRIPAGSGISHQWWRDDALWDVHSKRIVCIAWNQNYSKINRALPS